MTENEIVHKVTGMAIEVHNAPGPGLLESAYKECKYYKIGGSLFFKDARLECGYRNWSSK